jgi:hypothetical protein
LGKLPQGNPLGRENDVLVSVDRANHHVMTMQIQPDETRFSVTHETPL